MQFAPPSGPANFDLRRLGENIIVGFRDEFVQSARRRSIIDKDGRKLPFAQLKLPLKAERQRVLFVACILPSDATPRLIDHGAAEAGQALISEDMIEASGSELLDGLDADNRVKLLRFLLQSCPALLKCGAQAGYVAFCRNLVLHLLRRPPPARELCRLDEQRVLVETELDPRLGERVTPIVVAAQLVALEPGAHAIDLQDNGVAKLRAILPPLGRRTGALLVMLGESAASVRKLGAHAGGLPTLLDWVARAGSKDEPVLRRIEHMLACLAQQETALRPLARECALWIAAERDEKGLRQPPVSARLDLALATDAGVALVGHLNDPHELSSHFSVECDGAEVGIPLALAQRFTPPRAATRERSAALGEGFLAIAGNEHAELQAKPWRVYLVLSSGHRIALGEGRAQHGASGTLEQALALAPSSSSALHGYVEAIGPLYDEPDGDAPTVVEGRTVCFGRPLVEPMASVILGLGGDPLLNRVQLASFACSELAGQIEILCLGAQDRLLPAWEQVLDEASDIYGLSVRLLIAPTRRSFRAMLPQAIAQARGRLVGLLSSGLMPMSGDWLQRFAQFLDRRPGYGIVGGRLADPHGATLFSGGLFVRDAAGCWDVAIDTQRWRSGDERDGRPSDFVALDFAMARRSMLEMIGPLREDFAHEVYQDADFCLRAKSLGLAAWLADGISAERLEPQASPGGEARRQLGRRQLHLCWRSALDQSHAANDASGIDRMETVPLSELRPRRVRRAR